MRSTAVSCHIKNWRSTSKSLKPCLLVFLKQGMWLLLASLRAGANSWQQALTCGFHSALSSCIAHVTLGHFNADGELDFPSFFNSLLECHQVSSQISPYLPLGKSSYLIITSALSPATSNPFTARRSNLAPPPNPSMSCASPTPTAPGPSYHQETYSCMLATLHNGALSPKYKPS